MKAELLLPGPDNDSICDEGHTKLAYQGKALTSEIHRHQVSPFLDISPFGLEVELQDINIKIFDLQCACTDQ